MVKKFGNIPLKFAHYNKEGDIKQMEHSPASLSHSKKMYTLL